MDLRYALIIIGLVIIAAVVFNAIDKLRLIRRAGHGRNDRTIRFSDEDGSSGAIDNVGAIPGQRYQLDINPPPPTETNKKILTPDDPLKTQTEIEPVITSLRDELASLEQVASMPLDLDTLGKKLGNEVSSPSGHRSLLNERIDFIINLPGRGPVLRDEALGVYKQNEYLLDKPRHICGLRFRGGSWSDLENDPPFTEYSDLSLAIQLTDAKGPIEETELNTFVQMGLKMADTLQRPTRLSLPFEKALNRARELNEFCDKYDVIASINIVTDREKGFRGTDVDRAATDLGMQYGAMKIYHMKSDDILGCRHQFSLANLYKPGHFDRDEKDTSHTKGLTLFMSVACAQNPDQVFDKMMKTAEQLCQTLDGRMEDQDHRPLSKKGLSVIRSQIERMASDMVAQGIVPGSEPALRIF